MVKLKNIKISELDEKNLSKIEFKLNKVLNKPTIDGVYYKNLIIHEDIRGDLTELWSKPWADKEPVSPLVEHVYYNTTHEGVVKGWHMHKKTFSQYTCVIGKMQVVLADIRKDSPTYGYVDQFIIGAKNPAFIKIPPGVLKGWKSIKGDSVIINLLTSADVDDNYRVSWDSILKKVWQPING